jgi:methyl-accepting chemotaxis protein
MRKPKRFKEMKVGTKLILKSLGALILVLIAAFTFIVINNINTTQQYENGNLKAFAEKNAAVIKAQLEVPLDAAKTIAQSMQGYEELDVQSRRDYFNVLLKNVLKENPNFIGVWTCWGPGALDGLDNMYMNDVSSDGTGRFVPYWQWVDGEVVYTPLVDYETPGAGDYYLLARNSGQETIIEPFQYEMGGKMVLLTTVAVPVKDKSGNVVAVTGVDLTLEDLQSLAVEKGSYKTSEVCLLSNKGTYIISPDSDALGVNIMERQEPNSEKIAAAVASGQQYIQSGVKGKDGSELSSVYVPINIGNTTTPWSTGITVDTSEIMAPVVQMALILVAILAFIIVMSVIALVFIIKSSITKPIKETADFAKALASGKLDEQVAIRSNDEIGQLTSTLDNEVREAFRQIERAREVSDKQSRYQSEHVDRLVVNLERLSKGELYCDMEAAEPDEDTMELYKLFGNVSSNLHFTVDTLKGYIGEISDVLGEISSGNLCTGIDREYLGEFSALKDSINSIASSLSSVLSEINVSANQVAAGTAQVSDGSQQISQGAAEQASAIEQLTASVAEIAEQTRQNAEKTQKALSLAEAAQSESTAGNEQMKALQRAMDEINESSANISKIIKVIDDIAFQTNILALNAAVEAARAGVHGKGFAVVAEEVRNLAARSAKAAKETTELIESSVSKVEEGTKLADMTAQALTNILAGSEESAAFMNDIAEASNQQATGIAQVNRGIEQMAQVVQTNSATAEEAAAAAEELSSQAEMLKGMVGNFNLR